MPNWATGWWKIYGNKDKILEFLKENQNVVTPVFDEKDHVFEFSPSTSDKKDIYIKGTDRNYIDWFDSVGLENVTWYFHDDNYGLLIPGFNVAWAMQKEDIDLYCHYAKKYDLIFVFDLYEYGLMFEQHIKIYPDRKPTVNNVGYGEDALSFFLNCERPDLGG